MSEKMRVTFYLDKVLVDAIKDWIKTEAPHHDFFSALEMFLIHSLVDRGYYTTEHTKAEGWLHEVRTYKPGDSFVRPEPKTCHHLVAELTVLSRHRDEVEREVEREYAWERAFAAENQEQDKEA